MRELRKLKKGFHVLNIACCFLLSLLLFFASQPLAQVIPYEEWRVFLDEGAITSLTDVQGNTYVVTKRYLGYHDCQECGVVKVDKDGNKSVLTLGGLWTVNDMVFDDQGNLYITGGVIMDDGPATCISHTHAVTIKIAPDGTILWSRTIDNDHSSCSSSNSALNEHGSNVEFDGSGNVYISYYIGRPLEPGRNYLWVKRNSNGDILWEIDEQDGFSHVDSAGNIYVGTSVFNKYDESMGLICSIDNEYFVRSTRLDSENNIYIYQRLTEENIYGFWQDDYLVQKYDTNCNFLWEERFGRSGDNERPAGRLYIDHEDNAIVPFIETHAPHYDRWSMSYHTYSPEGQLIGAVGCSDYEQGKIPEVNSLVFDSSSNVYLLDSYGESCFKNRTDNTNWSIHLNGAVSNGVDSDGNYYLVQDAGMLMTTVIKYRQDVDMDNDGVRSGLDCDDNDETVYPGAPELCDGKNNDCDIATGDGTGDPLVGQPCDGGDPDKCEDGITVCRNDGLFTMIWCQDFTIYPIDPHKEICDNEDNDCDSMVDEDLGTLTCGVGECTRSVDACISGQPQQCIPGQPVVEVCDGIDNNCNGSVDDGLTVPLSDKQEGVCSGQVKLCDGANGWKEPDYGLIPDYEADETKCDTLDNDCDAQTDEYFIDADGDNLNAVGSCTPPPYDCDDSVNDPGNSCNTVPGDTITVTEDTGNVSVELSDVTGLGNTTITTMDCTISVPAGFTLNLTNDCYDIQTTLTTEDYTSPASVCITVPYSSIPNPPGVGSLVMLGCDSNGENCFPPLQEKSKTIIPAPPAAPEFIEYCAWTDHFSVFTLAVETDVDSDFDGWNDSVDNCPDTFNPLQADTDGDGIGDACEVAITYSPHACDESSNWAIEDFELLHAIDKWVKGEKCGDFVIGDFDLLHLIDYWVYESYCWNSLLEGYRSGLHDENGMCQ